MSGFDRRGVLLGAGALGAGAVIAACSSSTKTEPTASEATTSEASAGAESTSTKPAGTQIDASTVPVGGGRVLEDVKIVVTQPTAGQFHAFSAVCTHKGCTVNKVADGLIECPCHGSAFSASDGAAEHGPATAALAAKTVTADGAKLTVS
mgnify:FL=1